jgi:hypothetical protein
MSELEDSIESNPSNSKHSQEKSVSGDLTHPALRDSPRPGGDLHAGVRIKVER